MAEKITISGMSDDLVLVEGALPGCDEHGHAADGPGYLVASDGSIVSVVFDDEGAWRVALHRAAVAAFTLTQEGDPDGDDHSDVAELVGELAWLTWVGSDLDVAVRLAEAATSSGPALVKAQNVIGMLEDRPGFDRWWGDIDPADKAEIIADLTDAIAREVA